MAAKVAALVRDHWGDALREPRPFPGGSALLEGDRGWVLIDDEARRALGGALLWAATTGVRDLHLLVDDADHAGMLSRRAAAFEPSPTVWRITGRELAVADATPVPDEEPLNPAAAAFAPAIRAAGADVVVEHGVMTGEVLGLEVARVVVDSDGRAYLEAGVGKHDRHAQQVMRGDVPPEAALLQVVAAVREFRRADSPPHPYQRLGAERWLRCRIVDEPALVGAAQLTPVPALAKADDLRAPRPAPAAGVDAEDRPVLAVCSTGIDIDLVPTAADARVADGRDPHTLVVVPARDDQPALRTLVAALRAPVEIVTVPDDWRRARS